MRQPTKGHRVLNMKENSRNRAHVNHQKIKFSSGIQKDFVHGHNINKALMLTNQSFSSYQLDLGRYLWFRCHKLALRCENKTRVCLKN